MSGCPRTHRDPPASAFQVLSLKVCVTTPDLKRALVKGLAWTVCDRVSEGYRSERFRIVISETIKEAKRRHLSLE